MFAEGVVQDHDEPGGLLLPRLPLNLVGQAGQEGKEALEGKTSTQ